MDFVCLSKSLALVLAVGFLLPHPKSTNVDFEGIRQILLSMYTDPIPTLSPTLGSWACNLNLLSLCFLIVNFTDPSTNVSDFLCTDAY